MSTGLYSGTSGLALGVGLYAGNPGLWGGGAGFDAGLQTSLYLNFLAGAPLDPRITFTRGSNATLVDSTGKITYAPANLLLQSQAFEDAIWAKLNGTTTAANTTVAPDGTTTADTIIEAATTNIFGVRQSASLPAGSTAFSIYVKPNGRNWVQLNCAAGGSGSAFFNVSTGVIGTTSGATASISAAENGFYRCTIVVTATAGANTFDLRLASADGVLTYAGNGTSGVFAWGAQLEPVTYQTTPSTYNATTSAAYYGPRFDYDPVTLAAKGLLIEEARTNLLQFSEQFDNAAWAKTNSAITSNATTAPDGALTADKLTEAATTSVHRASQNFTTTAASHTFSIFVKASERTFALLFHDQSATGVAIDLSSGAISVPAGIGAPLASSSVAFGNGWYRCSITVAATAASNLFAVYPMLNATTFSYLGVVGSGIFIWGAQLEAGAFATSYIPTVASTVTRSADVATMTGTNFSSWYNQSAGTFVVDADRIGFSSSDMLFAASDSGSTNLLQQTAPSATSSRFNVRVGGVDQAILNTTVSASAVHKIASAYALDDFASVVNGGTLVTDTSGTIPTVDRLGIGSRLGSIIYNGHIRQIAYYNTRLPNATLVSLTA